MPTPAHEDNEFEPGMIIVIPKINRDPGPLIEAIKARSWTVLDHFGLHVVVGVPVGEEKALAKEMKARDDVEDAFLNITFHTMTT